MAKRVIAMIGTARDGAGGIASVIAAYEAHGLFARWPIVPLASHVSAGKRQKLRAFAGAFARYLWLLARGQVGLVHLHTSAGPSFWRKACFAYPAFLLRIPVLLHLHSGQFAAFYEQDCGPLRRRLIRFILECSARVIALSPSWRARTLGIAPRAQVLCLPNPAMAGGGQPRVLRRRVALFLGSISRDKGVFDLIAAWQPVLEIFPDARLVIAGEGAAMAAARERVAALGLAHAITLPGWVSGDAKHEWMAQADICVLPSYFEGMPMSLLEALAAGMPCVASAVGGIPELLRDGVEGRLVRPGDIKGLAQALVDVFSDEARYAAMSRAALARFADEFSADVVMPRLETLYAQLGVVPTVPMAPRA